MKPQDLLGLSVAVGITAIAVGLAFAGTVSYEMQSEYNKIEKQSDYISSPTQQTHTQSDTEQTSKNEMMPSLEHLKESVKISFNPSDQINLDTDNGFVRATVSYDGYQPQYGRVFLTIIPVNDPSNSYESEILLSQRGNDVWETEINHRLDKSEFEAEPGKLGQYVVKISTENGKVSGQAVYNISMPSIQQEVKVIPVIKPTQQSQIGIPEANTSNGLNINSMKASLENGVLKTYLGDLLQDYYDGNLTIDQVDELSKYDQINCDFVQQGDSLKLECELNVEK